MSTPAIPDFNIVIAIYEGVDLMDVAAPYEIFNWLKSKWSAKNVVVKLVAETTHTVKTRDNLILTPDEDFKCYNDSTQADLIWTPGGNPDNLQKMMQGGAYLDFLNYQAKNAAWVTSVCEGALLLAAAGLLNGYSATTHWAFIPCLQEFKHINVVSGYPRYVLDRDRMTGGGISSGLDESLELVQIIAGTDLAQQVQLMLQYYPDPPVKAPIPSGATCQMDLSGVKTR